MCKHGTTVDMEVTIPAHLSYTGETRQAIKPVDECIAPLVRVLNEIGMTTIGSCCGHGTSDPQILLLDGRVVQLTNEIA